MASNDKKHKTATVFVVDDNPDILEALELLIESVGLTVKTFQSARDFLDYPKCDGPCCLVSDIRMPELSGLELQKKMLEIENHTPIIFITAHADIPMSVKAMKRGAADFLEKPFKNQDLLDAIHKAIEHDKHARQNRRGTEAIQRRLESLSKREHEVFLQVVKGMLNKQIAYDLAISERTVKAHRASVMKKMEADSVADLTRMAYELQIIESD